MFIDYEKFEEIARGLSLHRFKELEPYDKDIYIEEHPYTQYKDKFNYHSEHKDDNVIVKPKKSTDSKTTQKLSKSERDTIRQDLYEPEIKEKGYKNNPEGAIKRLLHDKRGVIKDAIYKEGIGDIDFTYGKIGTAKKKYHDGCGISHILHNHGQKTLFDIPKMIQDGKIIDEKNRHIIVKQDKNGRELYRVIVGGNSENEEDTIYKLVTGFYKTNKSKKTKK